MAPPSSAKEKAVKTQVTAASTKEITTAGPASATVSERPTKMPVPTTAPMPKQTSWNRPMVRLRPWPSRSAPDSATSSSGDLTRAAVGRMGWCSLSVVRGGHGPFSGWRQGPRTQRLRARTVGPGPHAVARPA